MNNFRQTPDIPDLDYTAGLSYIGGDVEFYHMILESFTRDAPGFIQKLVKIDESSLYDFAVNAHALKGIAAQIAAKDVSEQAALLEGMAYDGNIDGIKERNQALAARTTALVEQIRGFLASFDAGSAN
ncbi:MAG: hypothetical protein FWG10_06300 [Eubacteriaceae bacterium]|nr:hypothetical protein [Eubacteriaceae bacterium]